ncbi:MAG TPA: BON domain-containing protein [Candidatus Angelobacter sp.]|nr:BON domain-containing protein [Candidatus Angelobacter sp.]
MNRLFQVLLSLLLITGAAMAQVKTSQQPRTTPPIFSGHPQYEQPKNQDQSVAQGNPGEQSSTQSSAQSSGTQSAPATSTGTDTQSRIAAGIRQEPSLSGADVAVTVTDKVELTGTVPSEKEKKVAERVAEYYGSGLKVVNHIRIAGENQPANSGGTPPR